MSSWEKIAELTYASHSMKTKAMAAGRAIDNALIVKNSEKSGTSKGGVFMNSNYFAYFDYPVIIQRGLINNHIQSIKLS